MVLGELAKLLHVVGGRPDKCFQLVAQVAEVARDQLELGGTLGGELGSGQAAGQQQQRQRDGGDAEHVPSGQWPCLALGSRPRGMPSLSDALAWSAASCYRSYRRPREAPLTRNHTPRRHCGMRPPTRASRGWLNSQSLAAQHPGRTHSLPHARS